METQSMAHLQRRMHYSLQAGLSHGMNKSINLSGLTQEKVWFYSLKVHWGRWLCRASLLHQVTQGFRPPSSFNEVNSTYGFSGYGVSGRADWMFRHNIFYFLRSDLGMDYSSAAYTPHWWEPVTQSTLTRRQVKKCSHHTFSSQEEKD